MLILAIKMQGFIDIFIVIYIVETFQTSLFIML